MPRRRYTSDLTDAEWALFEQRLQEFRRTNRGRPATISKREMVNAILRPMPKCSRSGIVA